MMNDLERAKTLYDELVENRRFLHTHPELGMNLPETTTFVQTKLREMGIEPKLCGGSGVTALIGGKKPGPVVLLRADMDALPMREESGLPFASTREAAHTCGHDLHATMLLGAAKLLKEEEDNLPGTVKLMFQPGEETLEGAKAMLADGILENPHVDAAFACHMGPTAPCGYIAYRAGTVNTSSDNYFIEITGKGGHGASPQKCIDPINTGVHIYLALQELISREKAPDDQVALTVGEFNAGHATNIIPKTALLGVTLRTVKPETREYMNNRIHEIVEGVAKTYRCQAEIKPGGSTCAVTLDEECANTVGEAFTGLFGKGAGRINGRVDGSEDFGEVSSRVPSLFFLLGGANPEEPEHYYGHHPRVRYDERSLPYGVAAYVCAAKAWLRAHAEQE